MAATFAVALEQVNSTGVAGEGDGAYGGERIDSGGNHVASGGQVLNTVENTWGGHRSAVVRTSDGSMYFLRLVYDTYATGGGAGAATWKLRKRTSGGTYSNIASGSTYDDVTLLRDPRDDTIYVTAWPAGVWKIFSSRDADWAGGTPAGTTISGSWESVGPGSRHYGNTGIAPDGTIAFKASRETGVVYTGNPTTSATNTEYITGRYNKATSAWEWGTFQTKYIGNRYSYDYLFPNPDGLPKGIYGLSENDLRADTAGYTAYYAANGGDGNPTYIFNGYKDYYLNPLNPSDYIERNESITDPNAAATTTALVFRPEDALIDLKGRLCVLYYVDGDGTAVKVRGFYLSVSRRGKLLYDGVLTGVSTAGNVKLVEDANGNLYVILVNLGSVSPQCTVYRIKETLPSSTRPWGNPTFAVNGSSSLSASLGNLAPQAYAIQLACARGGNVRLHNAVDIVINCRNTDYSGGSYNTANSYNRTSAQGGQKIYYGQINFG